MGVSNSKPHPVETKYYHEFAEKLPSMNGKTIAITGCTSGTGFIAARTSIAKGADNVLLLNRPSERATKAEEQLKEAIQADSKTTVETIPCDLQDFASVKQAAATIQQKYEAVDVLCNNAGVMALEDYATKDGYDVQMQTNHLSHFLLTKELFPLLQKAKALRGEARIVNHTSLARMQGKPLDAQYLEKNGGNLGGNGSSMFFGGAKWLRYHQSKLANSVYTMALTDRLADTGGIKAVCAAPGLSATNLQLTTNNSGGGMGGSMWIMHMAQSAEDGTMPLLAACLDPSTENGDFWEPKNGGNMYGPAVKVPFDKLSSDAEARKLLWEKSEDACGKFEI